VVPNLEPRQKLVNACGVNDSHPEGIPGDGDGGSSDPDRVNRSQGALEGDEGAHMTGFAPKPVAKRVKDPAQSLRGLRHPPVGADQAMVLPMTVGAVDAPLTVAAVARRLGVAPATLRTWDRRYGLGPSEHAAGAHRRYLREDLARLLTMRRLTLEGVAPSEAARTALAVPSSPVLPSEVEVLDAYDAASMPPDPDGLVAAACHIDNAAVRWMLARVHPRDPLAWWSELVRPALGELVRRPVVERPGESAVRLLEAAAYAELRGRAAAVAARIRGSADADVDPTPATVLAVPVGVAPDLVLHVLAVALMAGGVVARMLSGGGVDDIAEAVEDVGARALVVHVGGDEADVERGTGVIEGVSVACPGLPLFVHREGRDPLDLAFSADLHHVRSLAGAYHEIMAILS
jgi:MerR family transcriptional regulator, light-induced transcriptional regulator